MFRASCGALFLALVATVAPAPAQSPPPPFLVIDQDRLLSESATGRAVLAEEEDARAALLQEGRSLDRAFEAEERALTDQRATMSPQAFRPLADAFDEKVVATRRAQEQKALTLTREAEERRRAFFANVTPILLQILRETGAAAVVDQR
ncbi:MAG: OmpH family outer membrane protein, partial [Pseudomonadota bacterium]